MDWHKLQNTLFELDPTDPREDLAKLQAAANGGGADVPPTKDYVAESVEVAEGSMPLGIDSIADFAALAGVRLDEKQKTGAAGQAKGKGPMPSTSKPSTSGEQKHPLKDKLVGEDDGFAGKVKQGFKSYNNMSGVMPNSKAKTKASPEKVKGSVAPVQLNRMLQVSDQTAFTQAIMKSKQGQALTLPQTKALAEAFQKIMAMDPQETQRVMMLLKRMEGEPPKESVNNSSDSIKEQLWAALNAIDKS